MFCHACVKEIDEAFESVRNVDVLELSKEGGDAWLSSLNTYDTQIDRVQARLTSRLRDQLGMAKNANEMFRIFGQYNALFVHPHIRGAIREYQAQLIKKVKEDIDALHAKLKLQYGTGKSARMSHARDIPLVAGSIIWMKQIERQLGAYMKRVESVLGKGWETHVDGQRLKSDGDHFKRQLNTQLVFEDWTIKSHQKSLGIQERLFVVESARNNRSLLTLRVNFAPETITLAKEVACYSSCVCVCLIFVIISKMMMEKQKQKRM